MHKNRIDGSFCLSEIALTLPLDPGLVSFSIDVMIHHSQKQLSEERIHFILPIIQISEGRNLRLDPGGRR